MNEEEVIKRRLLIDGDNAGDDRRINELLKLFIQWCNFDGSAEESNAVKEHMLGILAQCKYSYAKSRAVARMNAQELMKLEELSRTTKAEVEAAKKEITALQAQHKKEARMVRDIREVYSKETSELPDRKETEAKIAKIEAQISKFKKQREELDSMMVMSHALCSSLLHLNLALEDADNNAAINNEKEEEKAPSKL